MAKIQFICQLSYCHLLIYSILLGEFVNIMHIKVASWEGFAFSVCVFHVFNKLLTNF